MTVDFAHDSVMLRDVRSLERAFRGNRTRARAELEAAQARLAQRRASAPSVEFPDDLPIAAHLDEIRGLLAKHRVVIVAGETGSGKTTQLPKLCLAAGFGVRGMIGHTQPRRIAARAVARRIADELRVSVGDQVGYAVRFSDQTSPATMIKVMTDGLLLNEITSDRALWNYEVLIIDEAHERSLNIDFLLGYLTTLLDRRTDLKVVITSATIDVEAFARHFADAPVVQVSGRGHPVEVVYRPPDETEPDVDAQILEAIRDAERRPLRGANDILVFLTGEREIHETSVLLRRELRDRYDILPLYARLPAAEQQRIFAPGGRRRIVLATNVAETSLTVPNIGFVIDPGWARLNRYSYRSKLQRLPIERISQASADQRKGRCGRVAPGVCYRLYSEADYAAQPAYTDPEIRRTNLAAVVLQMRAFELGDIESFPFLDPPEPRAIRDAVTLLTELGAIEADRLTQTGRSMARLPIDPRLARMLVEAARLNALTEVLVIASGLAIQDPRERPLDARAAADAAHAKFADKRSDYLAYLTLWNWYETSRQALSSAALKRACQQHFLSFMRMREWRDLHRQLVLAVRQQNMRSNATPADYAAVHRSILAASLSLIGIKDERDEYVGARNLRFRIFPGSGVGARPKWLVCSEISETQRVYARCVAAVEPEWIEAASAHLVKRNYSEPHWDARRGEAVGYERVMLFGLTLVERRRVAYKRVDATVARDLFIRDGLLAGAVTTTGDFLRHNLDLVREVREVEARQRRRDLLVTDDALAGFYAERIPPDIVDVRAFEQWRRSTEVREPRLLYMSRDDVVLRTSVGDVENGFPSALLLNGVEFPLRYSFAPGAPDDGVSLQVPIGLLAHVRHEPLDWLVPGLLGAKCEALVRALPKTLRRPLAPVPEKIETILPVLLRADVYRHGRLERVLAERLAGSFDASIPLDAWRLEAVDPHLRMNVQVRDPNGALVDQDRDVEALLARLAARVERQVGAQRVRDTLESHSLVRFPNEHVPPQRVLDDGHGRLIVYPALEDRGTSVSLVMARTEAEQRRLSRDGYARMVLLAEQKTARMLTKRLKEERALGLHYAPLGPADALYDSLLRASVWHTFFAGVPLPQSRADFEQWVAERGSRWIGCFDALLGHAKAILAARFAAMRALGESCSPAYVDAVKAMTAHVARLVPADFLDRIPLRHLGDVPRYLDAVVHRLAGLQGRVDRDRALSAEIDAFEARLDKIVAKLGIRDDLDDVRFSLEEYRVAVFAQRLKTKTKVSAKRIEAMLTPLEEEAGVR
jgi:ATP-dependent helicase HrpA